MRGHGRRGRGNGPAHIPDKTTPSQSHFQLFKETLPYIWPEGQLGIRVRVVISAVLLVVGKLAELAVPFFLSEAIHQVSLEVNLPVEERSMSTLVGPILLYAGFRFAASAVAETRNIVFAAVSAYSERAVALRTFSHLQRLSLRFHLHRKTGSILRSVSRGSQSFASVTRVCLFQILPIALQVTVVCGFLAARYRWYFCVSTFSTIAAYLAFTLVTTEWRNKFRRDMNQKDNAYNQTVTDALINVETVKYFNAQAHMQRRVDSSLREYQGASIVSSQTLALLNGGQGLVISVGVLVVLLLAARDVVQGRMDVRDFVLVGQFVLALYAPLGFLGTYWRMLKQTFVDVENMTELLREPVEVVDVAGAPPLDVPRGEVRFEDVRFRYNDDREVLRGVTFTVRPGERVAVVGQSGSGKTTLGRLLYRFYDLDGGRISVDGQDVSRVQLHSLRKHMAIVPQDCVLFNSTVGYNIAFGAAGEGDVADAQAGGSHFALADGERAETLAHDSDEVREAARAASIHEFILSQGDGFLTEVGERGLRLSGGEKQRVAIARAVLKRPKIMLFDEATSSLDTQTEQEIQEALDTVSRGRTSIVIAHRLSTVVNADRIVVLKHGRVVEQGRHAELLAIENGEYRLLWERQREEQAVLGRLEEVRRAGREPEASQTPTASELDGPRLEADAADAAPAEVAIDVAAAGASASDDDDEDDDASSSSSATAGAVAEMALLPSSSSAAE